MKRFIDPAGKLLGHMDRLAELQAGGRPPPVNVEVDVSNRCNLGCHGCHFSHLHSRGPHANTLPDGYEDTGDLIDTSLLRDLPGILARAGVRSITWTGGGEPVLHPKLPAALIATSTLLDQGLYTNGTLLDDGLAQIIKRTCKWVYVSMDYANLDDYATWKGVDAYGDAVAGASKLAAAEGDATLGMGFMLGSHNWKDMQGMVELGRAIGVDYIQFRPMVVTDPLTPGKPAEDTGWIGYFLAAVQAVDMLDMPDVILDVNRFGLYGNWKMHGYAVCHWCSLQTVVTPDGRLWCCANRRGQPEALIGSFDNSLGLTWLERDWPVRVNSGCRVLCRGHLPNLVLTDILQEQSHRNFI